MKKLKTVLKTVNGQLSGVYINANDKRRNAINNRAKCIHRDIKRKLHVVDQKWNQSADTMGPCEAWFTGPLFIPLRKNTVISILGGLSFWDDEIVHIFYL